MPVRARFLHMADCHLGYRQYNSKERFNDFNRAFISIVRSAIDAEVDFVLLAGDLFEKRSIDALTLAAAMRGLERLARAGIPCIAVEGNHELSYYNEAISWMEFLAERELLILLHPEFSPEEVKLPPYARRQGAYVEPVPGLRVYGLRYYGSGTAKAVERVAAALDQHDRTGIEYTIFLAHTGVEGVIPGDAGGLSHRQLAPLRPHVDYLALGHVHKPFEFDGWIYNPGSPETCSMTEAAWTDRGYYLVEVDTERPRAAGEPAHVATLHPNPRRPFVRLSFATDHCASTDELYSRCGEYIRRQARDRARRNGTERPVVELRLQGILPFDRSGLDLGRLETMVRESLDPILCLVRNVTQPSEFAVAADAQLSRHELERQIVSDLLSRDVRFRGDNEAWTDLTLSLKKLALTGASPETILAELSQHTGRVSLAPPPGQLTRTTDEDD